MLRKAAHSDIRDDPGFKELLPLHLELEDDEELEEEEDEELLRSGATSSRISSSCSSSGCTSITMCVRPMAGQRVWGGGMV